MENILATIFVFAVLFILVGKLTHKAQSKKISGSAENAELLRVLLGLEPDSLEQLFALYRQQFGAGAARYAKHTYMKWKAGTVRPNRQTFRRFLTYLPKVMSFDLKCEVMRTLRDVYCSKDSYSVVVNKEDWKEKLVPLLRNIVEKANEAELPGKLQSRLDWLAEADAKLANAILKRSETEESRHVVSMLEKEFLNIERLIDELGTKAQVVHVIKLPLSTVTVKISP